MMDRLIFFFLTPESDESDNDIEKSLQRKLRSHPLFFGITMGLLAEIINSRQVFSANCIFVIVRFLSPWCALECVIHISLVPFFFFVNMLGFLLFGSLFFVLQGPQLLPHPYPVISAIITIGSIRSTVST